MLKTTLTLLVGVFFLNFKPNSNLTVMKKILLVVALFSFLGVSYAVNSTELSSNNIVLCEDNDKCDKKDCKKKDSAKAKSCDKAKAAKCCSKAKAKTCDKAKAGEKATEEKEEK